MTFLRTLVSFTLLMAFSLPALAAEPTNSPGLGLKTAKDTYDWAQFKDMSEKKRTCYARFVTDRELEEIATGVKPLKIRLQQKTKQLNIFCSR